MKKKLMMGMVASGLVLALAVGGTLMIFSSSSAPATNVATLGSAKIALQETDGTKDYQTLGLTYTDHLEHGTYAADVFQGINFGTLSPGASLTKKPRVQNSGSVPVYVAVKGTLTVEQNGGNVDLAAWTSAHQTELAAYFDEGNITGLTANGWKNPANTGELSFTGGVMTARWYYNNNTDSLTALAPGAFTPDLFTGVKFPLTLDNSWSDVKLTLTLKAYAVQSDFVGGLVNASNAATWQPFFASAFPSEF